MFSVSGDAPATVIETRRLTGFTGVADSEWLYQAKFDVSADARSFQHAELVFEGLDTICDVYLVSVPRWKCDARSTDRAV